MNARRRSEGTPANSPIVCTRPSFRDISWPAQRTYHLLPVSGARQPLQSGIIAESPRPASRATEPPAPWRSTGTASSWGNPIASKGTAPELSAGAAEWRDARQALRFQMGDRGRRFLWGSIWHGQQFWGRSPANGRMRPSRADRYPMSYPKTKAPDFAGAFSI